MAEFNQSKYIAEYQKKKYDRCIFNVPKGQKEILLENAHKKGYKDLSNYIKSLIEKDQATH